MGVSSNQESQRCHKHSQAKAKTITQCVYKADIAIMTPVIGLCTPILKSGISSGHLCHIRIQYDCVFIHVIEAGGYFCELT